MKRHSSTTPHSSRCGKPTTVLSAWPESERAVARDSFTEVPLDDLLESSLMNSLADILSTHEMTRLQAQRSEVERVALEEKRRANEAEQARRAAALEARALREARRADIHRMRENLARRDGVKQAQVLQASIALQTEQDMEKRAQEFAFTQEIEKGKLTQGKRHLRQLLQAAALVSGIGLVVSFSSWTGANTRNEQELNSLAAQTSRIETQAREKVAALEAELANLDSFAVEQKQTLEQSLETARQELAQAQNSEEQRGESFQNPSQPPKQGPRRLAQGETKSPAPRTTTEANIPTSGQVASSISPYESLEACNPHDPMCFEL